MSEDVTYNFERFVDVKPKLRRNATPQYMRVGQIVVRRNVKPGTVSGLRSLMRKAMREGASFSVDHGKDFYAIRRDS